LVLSDVDDVRVPPERHRLFEMKLQRIGKAASIDQYRLCKLCQKVGGKRGGEICRIKGKRVVNPKAIKTLS
jgi:hypothetical protein